MTDIKKILRELKRERAMNKKFRVEYGETDGDDQTIRGSRVISAEDYDDALDKWSNSKFFCRSLHTRQPINIVEVSEP